ncbi:HAD hydrolase family protein [Caproiciproducens sp. MSJ-32]|nr:HAD hydrolase family protein [Caproiciproducens sp. MSJ-32]
MYLSAKYYADLIGINTPIIASNGAFIKNGYNDKAILSYEGNILKAGVIENSENDLSMINYAGIGVAMGNGLDIVKEAADFITDTNDNSGVGKAIKHFVLDCNE